MSILNNAQGLKLGSSSVDRVYLGGNRIWPPFMWLQKGQDIAIGSEGNYGGWSVSLSDDGNTLATGAPLAGGSVVNSGSVKAYGWDGSTWAQKGGEIVGDSAGDCLGWSVGLSGDGNVLAVGSPFRDESGSDSGQVKVYEWDGLNWTQRGSSISGNPGDTSGWSLSLDQDGTVLTIGAPLDASGGTMSGSVKAYEWINSEWTQKGVQMNGVAGEQLGCSISVNSDGSAMAAGAPSANKTRIYSFDGSSWVSKGPDITGENPEDQSGHGVCLSDDGNGVAIGAPSNDDSGHVRVQSWDGSSWTTVGSDIDGEFAGRQSGFNVSMSANGTVVATGVPLNANAQSNSSILRVLEWNGSSWVARGNLIDGAEKGCSVSLDAAGDTVAIGIPLVGVVKIYRLT